MCVLFILKKKAVSILGTHKRPPIIDSRQLKYSFVYVCVTRRQSGQNYCDTETVQRRKLTGKTFYVFYIRLYSLLTTHLNWLNFFRKPHVIGLTNQ